ncbi:hypothetical protein K2173_007048 [Erythroxylum novogranatense]|uniref:Ribosomal protein L23 n=1 Tax=Erythroxylum novogranatense TaxID=1862640 RepID=A0AAV8SL00_9ROSI|nr:hypothetical protein K2173_007048 [Erythroxylum novogranatense]
MSNQDPEIKHWVELFFGVKVIAMNSHRLPGKGRRMTPIMGHTVHDIYINEKEITSMFTISHYDEL